jgi:hypothetical protein
VELRHQRLHLRHIARMLGAPFSTVARALNRLGLGLPRFRGQVDRRHAMTLRLSFDDHHDHVPTPVYGAAKG